MSLMWRNSNSLTSNSLGGIKTAMASQTSHLTSLIDLTKAFFGLLGTNSSKLMFCDTFLEVWQLFKLQRQVQLHINDPCF